MFLYQQYIAIFMRMVRKIFYQKVLMIKNDVYNGVNRINPIKNIWSIVKRKVENKTPKNIDELKVFQNVDAKTL
jgi:hypothetical protein